ncbi:MAG: hypothetical protein ABI091_09020 [Ferruginibacter sp.]
MYPSKTLSFPFILFFLFLVNISAKGQTNNPLINSGDVINNGAKLFETKKFSQAIDSFKKINRSDTNYYKAVFETGYAYYLDSQFNKALEYFKLGEQLFPNKYTLFSMQEANTLDELDRSNEAIKIYDSAITKTPYDCLLFFNRGVVNYKLKNYTEAKRDMQKCLLINPFYSSAHYYLGRAYLLQGNLVPAMLAFKTYLLVEPGGKYYKNAIANLSDISKVTDDVLEYVKNNSSTKEDNFSLQQEILLSKLSLDKQYKLKADLEDNIVRQIQVVDEKLEYSKNDKGFCMQFYVPFYVNTLKNGNFETMIFYIFSGIGDKKIDSWLKSNKKDKEVFINYASNYFDEIKRTEVLDYTKRESETSSYVYNNQKLFGKGVLTKDKDPLYIGKWDFFFDNGITQATGSFNDAGKKNGLWTYYYDNGQVKEKTNAINGLANGLAEGWFDNGNKRYNEKYIDGKVNGIQTIYYYNGKVKSIINYKDDLKNGIQKYFDYKGQLSSTQTTVDDKLEGNYKSYYPNGAVKNEVNYIADKEEGTYKSFYQSGKLYAQGEYKNDKRQGLWIFYYESGAVSQKTSYQDDDITGDYSEYYENGQVSAKGAYYKKKIDGTLENFDEDGKKYVDYVYEKGKLREVNFYDKKGNSISTTTTRKGAANIVFYNPEGIKASEGFFTKGGDKDGKFVTYFNSGKISQETNWKNGIQDGPQIDYYQDGKIKRSSNFTDGDEDGYVKDFNANGSLNSEGWIVKGDKQQQRIFYNNVGDITSKEYYLNNELSGYSENYSPGNKISSEYSYYNGWLSSITQFDSTGKILVVNKLDKGNGIFIYKYPNGKNSYVGNYNDYMQDGASTSYFPDGKIFIESYFKNDSRDSIYKVYYYGGKLKMEGKFSEGQRTGDWKFYYKNGKISEEETYVNGDVQGIDKIYMTDGGLDKIISFKDGQLDGAYKAYGDKNELAIQLNYKAGTIKSYQYEEKPGVLCAPIIIKGGTGKLIAKYPNGKESAILNYLNNEQQGERKIFYSDGNICSESIRLNGYTNGSLKIYYPNGKVWQEENYVVGNLQGPRKSYYPDGKIESEENYYNDQYNGINKYYDEQGKLKQTFIYYYDTLLDVK